MLMIDSRSARLYASIHRTEDCSSFGVSDYREERWHYCSAFMTFHAHSTNRVRKNESRIIAAWNESEPRGSGK